MTLRCPWRPALRLVGIVLFGAAPAIATAAAENTRPQLIATPLVNTPPPVIDGVLDDPAWAQADVVDAFSQAQPVPGAAPTERTELRVLYDRDQLYIAIYCHDDQPAQIKSGDMSRDEFSPAGDYIRIILDPTLSRRNAYIFEVNPASGYTDALLQNNSVLLTNWSAIWSRAGRRVADGWIAEMAIPFRNLSFDAGSDTWGFDVVRQIKRKSEVLHWSPAPAGLDNNDISTEGTLTGLAGLSQGHGLDVQLYGVGRYGYDWPGRRGTLYGDASATAYYRITPALTGTATYNPDFSDTPLDQRQVNTSRFSLFQPETREFFLQDAAAFEFGGRNFFKDAVNGEPFFSRNIGLVNGHPVDLLGGLKLSGQVGDTRIGALSVRTQDAPDAPAETLSVLRVAQPILGNSTIGVLATNGDPLGLDHNSLVGADFQYHGTGIGGTHDIRVDSYFERSLQGTGPDDNSFGVDLSLPKEPWVAELRGKQIGANFHPALGFVNRTDVRDYLGVLYHAWRPQFTLFNYNETGVHEVADTDLSNHLEYLGHTLFFFFSNAANGNFELDLTDETENIDAPFTLPGGLTIPAGHYHYDDLAVNLGTSDARPLSLMWNYNGGQYYDGDSSTHHLQLTWRPDIHLKAVLGYQLTEIHLPRGHSSFHVTSLDAELNFTAAMQLAAQLQYDDISEQFGASLRYLWQITPYTELLVTMGESAYPVTGRIGDISYHSQGSAWLVRFGHRFQY
ncbi:MAG TPA: carbohydrate binding family 9 domain-containing protein [Steroidobacteraceae bacterium]|nr:carbohydrate binding family 9 domain-containing protein [Steroidobacteraceae bacterium]